MSLQALVLSLIDGITDPALRAEISSTIFFLAEVFESGKVSEKEIYNDLREIVSTVLDITQPDLFGEEKRKRVEELAKQLMTAIKARTLRTRLFRRRRI